MSGRGRAGSAGMGGGGGGLVSRRNQAGNPSGGGASSRKPPEDESGICSKQRKQTFSRGRSVCEGPGAGAWPVWVRGKAGGEGRQGPVLWGFESPAADCGFHLQMVAFWLHGATKARSGVHVGRGTDGVGLTVGGLQARLEAESPHPVVGPGEKVWAGWALLGQRCVQGPGQEQ